MVKLCSYSWGKGLELPDEDTPETKFTNIDADLWARRFLSALDRLLSPASVAQIELVEQLAQGSGNFLERLRTSRDSLACSVSKLLTPVCRGAPAGGESDAREAFRKAMLEEIGNAYAIDAAIHFTIGISDSKPRTFLFAAKGRGDDQVSASELVDTVEVPIVRRAYPVSPTLVYQSDVESAKAGPEGASPSVDLSEVSRWTYSFTYAGDRHYPQDCTSFEVSFNVGEGVQSEAPQPDMERGQQQDLVQSLAQFAMLFPDIDEDLREPLALITAESEPALVDGVATALDSFATIADWIARAWASSSSATETPPLDANAAAPCRFCRGFVAVVLKALAGIYDWFALAWKSETALPDAPRLASDSADLYSFDIVESAQDPADGNSPLVVTLRETVSRPERVGAPIVCIPDCETKSEAMPTGSRSPVEFRFTFDRAGSPVTAKQGMRIAQRQVWIPGIDPFERQSAQVEGYVTRNGELVPGSPSADEFVYRTAPVTFANPMQPLIDIDTRLDLSRVGSTKVQTRPLAQHLANMFDSLFQFESPRVGTRGVRLECSFEYPLGPDLADVSLPVLLLEHVDLSMATDTMVPVEGSGSTDSESLVCSIARSLDDWFDRNRPVTVGGRFRFALTVFSTLTRQPLARLNNLEISLDHLGPRPTGEGDR